MKTFLASTMLAGALLAIVSSSQAGTVTFTEYSGQADSTALSDCIIAVGAPPAGLPVDRTATWTGFDLYNQGGGGIVGIMIHENLVDVDDATITFSGPVIVSSMRLRDNIDWGGGGAMSVVGRLNGTNVWTYTSPGQHGWEPMTLGTNKPIDQLAVEGMWRLFDDFVVDSVDLTDSDGDGIPDYWETAQFGNLTTANGTSDYDGDGLTDLEEYYQTTDPKVADTDGDGSSDGAEVHTSLTDPLKADTDGDGLTDGQEVNTYHTNPLIVDTDGDGISDGQEVINGTDPLVPNFISYFKAVGGYRDNLIQVPKATDVRFSWQVVTGAVVTIDQGVGDVTSLTFNGTGSNTVLSVTASAVYTLTASNAVTHVFAKSSVQVVVLPDGVGFVTFSDMPATGVPMWGNIPPLTPIAGLPAGVTATWTGWSWGDDGGIPGFKPDVRNLWITTGYGNASYDATVEFSQPVILARFETRNPPWGGPTDPGSAPYGGDDVGAQGSLGGVPQWTWAAPLVDDGTTNHYLVGDGLGYAVTAGAGIMVDTVAFKGLWRNFDNFVIETTAGLANHAAIHLASPAMQNGKIVNSWNSQTGWVYSMQTNNAVGASWNQLDLDLAPSAGTTTTHTNTAGAAQGFYRVLRAP